MANTLIQLEGTFKTALTGDPVVDYSLAVSRYGLPIQRNMVDVPPTLGDARGYQLPGSRSESLTIQFHSNRTAASLYGLLRDAVLSDDGLLDFELIESSEVVSVDNPKFSGTMSIPMLDGTVDVGALRQATVTFPITVWNAPVTV